MLIKAIKIHVVTIKANPLIATNPPSLLMTILAKMHLPKNHHCIIPMTTQSDTSLPCPCNQCSDCKETCSIKWANCKMNNPTTSIQTAKDFCALSQDSHRPKSYKLQSQLATSLICHHIAILSLTPPTTSTLLGAPPNIISALTDALPAMIPIMMIVAIDIFQAHTTITFMLAIMTFRPLLSIRLAILTILNHFLNQSKKIQIVCLVTVPSICKGTLIQTQTPIILFILMAMDIVKNPRQLT